MQSLRAALPVHVLVGQQPVALVKRLADLVSLAYVSASHGVPDLTVYPRCQPAAYIQARCLSPDRATVQVAHFALEPALPGQGYGQAVTEGFAAAVRDAFPGVATIDFWECRYEPTPYRAFFRMLGARAVPDRLYGKRRPHLIRPCTPDRATTIDIFPNSQPWPIRPAISARDSPSPQLTNMGAWIKVSTAPDSELSTAAQTLVSSSQAKQLRIVASKAEKRDAYRQTIRRPPPIYADLGKPG